ncbi:prohead protease/major capsid protein fusion protein [Roseomonas genomospecies 6]|uniref:Peptidase n=1 Tax=Roseomonas genomospecies 6 TaxID=214106 RepID=A0A9W7KQT5_9PROT|nr:prohead protease/major capsid protein fusion protein [Roseomonas genomospecies 6]KAA0677777.1 peptidase [Roseomonas genomospecies 6]
MTAETYTRGLAFAPSTLDTAARTVEVVALSGPAPVIRPAPAPDGTRSAWIEELDAAGANLSRLIGAPALKDHRNAVDSAVGVVSQARAEGNRIVAAVAFDTSAPASDLIGKVQAGSVRGVSLGYSIQRWHPAGNRNGLPVFRAVAWTPHELSFTPVPADAGATVRSHEDPMTIATTETTTETPAVVTTETRTSEPMHTRAAVNVEIRSMARVAGLGQDFVDAQIDASATIEQARAAAFAAMAQRSGGPIRTEQTYVQVIADHNDPTAIRSAMADALSARLNPAVKPEGRAREFMGVRLLDMARDLSAARGERMARSDAAAVDALFTRSAHSTSDFPLLLENAVNKAMLPGYASAAPTYRTWAAQRSFNDFRPHKFLRIGDFPSLKEIGEGGETKFGTVSENREEVTAKEFGTGIAIGRRALINDDLGALQNFTAMIGVRVASDENAMAYALLSQNPTLADGKAVFHTGHGNKAASGAALDVTSMAAAVKALRSQTSLDGIKLNVAPRYLVIGPALELTARQLLASIVANQTSNVNPWSGLVELVIDANITGNEWYLFADPAMVPNFVFGYVAGTSGPVVRSEIDFDTRAFKVAVGLDFGVGAIDFRGAYLNAGA